MDGIFVDDSDPNVIFSANWFTGLGTYEYNKTAHGTTAATTNVIYSFKGTSISAYGTIGALPINTSTTPNGTWSIDGTTPIVFQVEVTNTTLYRQLFFQTPDLPDNGDHTLELTFHTENTTIVWFDYLMVTPSTHISDGGNKLVKVDDTDSGIQYTGIWDEQGSSFDSNKTAHVATSSTSKAVLSFYGTSITVFGRLPNITASPGTPAATFTLDNNAPIVFNTVPPGQVNTLYQVPLFQSFNLSLDHHQLQIEAHDDNSNIWIDFFMYEQPAELTTTTTTSGSNSPTLSASHHSSSNHTTLIDHLVGGIVGGVIGFILIVAILAWLSHRRQRRDSLNLNDFTPYIAVETTTNGRGSLDHFASTPIRTAGTLPRAAMSHTAYPSFGSLLPSGNGPLPPPPPTTGSSHPSQVSLYQPMRKTPLRLSPTPAPLALQQQHPSTTTSETMSYSSAIPLQEEAGAGTLPPPYESHGL